MNLPGPLPSLMRPPFTHEIEVACINWMEDKNQGDRAHCGHVLRENIGGGQPIAELLGIVEARPEFLNGDEIIKSAPLRMYCETKFVKGRMIHRFSCLEMIDCTHQP